MARKKLSPWFPWYVKPVHHGIYKVRSLDEGGAFYSYWDGGKWGGTFINKETADLPQWREYTTSFQKMRWRGLAEKP